MIRIFAKESPLSGYIDSRGWGNGYVCIPEGHHMHGLDYDEIHRRYDIDVNGGLTFSESAANCKNWELPDFVKDTDWVIGFDTAHWGDSLDRWPNEASVLAEARRLADQIEASTPYQSPEEIKQELVTRLYNLVNALDLMGSPDYNTASIFETIELRKTEARETLKKVIP